jgi:prophage DNA circulation protein
MIRSELDEALALALQVLGALTATLSAPPGAAGAQLVWVCSQLTANAAIELNVTPTATVPAPFWADFSNCFEQARIAGASFAAMEKVRALAAAFTPATPAAVAVANFAARMALVEQAQILAASTFTSRQQIDRYLDQVNTGFDAAETIAADRRDNVAYRALITLHAAVVNDLSSRARPLPRMVTLNFPTRQPSLALAQRIYQDGSRANEIVAENSVVHPAFCPMQLQALSA